MNIHDLIKVKEGKKEHKADIFMTFLEAKLHHVFSKIMVQAVTKTCNGELLGHKVAADLRGKIHCSR